MSSGWGCDYGIEIVEEPVGAQEPVSLQDAKDHLSVAESDAGSDRRIALLIRTARDLAERFTRRQIVPRDLMISLKSLPEEIELPGGIVRSVVQVEYLNTSDAFVVASASLYETLLTFQPPRIRLKPNQQWPTLGQNATVRAKVTYSAGWESPANVPPAIKHAMLLAIGNWHHQRGDDAAKAELPNAAISLLNAWQLPQYQ